MLRTGVAIALTWEVVGLALVAVGGGDVRVSSILSPGSPRRKAAQLPQNLVFPFRERWMKAVFWGGEPGV